MSDEAACPDNSLMCDSPVSLACSFKGCPPVSPHDPSYEVTQLGGQQNSLRGAQAQLVCAGDQLELELKLSVEGAPVTLTIEPCTDVDGYKLSSMEKFLGLNSYTCAGYLDSATASCFDLKFADCELDTVSLISGNCRTECLKYSIKSTSEDSTFMWSDQDPKLLALDYEKYEALLLAQNWLDTTFQESPSLQLQCSDKQTWDIISPNQRIPDINDLNQIPCIKRVCGSADGIISDTDVEDLSSVSSGSGGKRRKRETGGSPGTGVTPSGMVDSRCCKNS